MHLNCPVTILFIVMKEKKAIMNRFHMVAFFFDYYLTNLFFNAISTWIGTSSDILPPY